MVVPCAVVLYTCCNPQLCPFLQIMFAHCCLVALILGLLKLVQILCILQAPYQRLQIIKVININVFYFQILTRQLNSLINAELQQRMYIQDVRHQHFFSSSTILAIKRLEYAASRAISMERTLHDTKPTNTHILTHTT